MSRRILFSLALIASWVATGASAQGIKFHPGDYLMLNGGDSLSAHLTQIDQIGGVSSIKGVGVRIWWKDLETSKGVYNFSMIDTYLTRLKKYNKRLVVRVMDRRFNTSSSSNIVPSYLMTSTYDGGVTRSRTGYVAHLWESEVMDRLIALYRAMGQRYNDNDYFEGITTEESTLALPSTKPARYSDGALEKQYERLANNVCSAMPNTAMFMNANWLGSNDVMSRLISCSGLRIPECQLKWAGGPMPPQRRSGYRF